VLVSRGTARGAATPTSRRRASPKDAAAAGAAGGGNKRGGGNGDPNAVHTDWKKDFQPKWRGSSTKANVTLIRLEVPSRRSS
jgi:hypothetical protein